MDRKPVRAMRDSMPHSRARDQRGQARRESKASGEGVGRNLVAFLLEICYPETIP
jgi:hypothetical protein